MTKNTAMLSSYERLAFDYSAMDADAADVVQQAASRIRDRQRAAIVDIGRELNAVKAALPHGQFTPWIKAEFGWSHGTALNFMRVADTIGDEFATVAHLPPAVIYKLAAPSTPPEIREQVLRVEPGKTINSRDVVRLIDETRERQDKAERRARKNHPTPEDLAKAQAKERREARERAKREAEIEAEDHISRQAAQAIRDALGDRLPTIITTMEKQSSQARYTFLRELLKPIGSEAVA